MRIRSNGKYAYRKNLVGDVDDLLDEKTRSGAVEASTEFTQTVLPASKKPLSTPT